jgi:hypothetical protein
MPFNLNIQKSDETLEDQFESYLQRVGVTVQKALTDSQRPLVQALANYPRPAVLPFQFATPKSRRYYFWMISQGMVNTDGQRYIRSNRYKRSWETNVTSGKGVYTLELSNRWKASKFVGGDLTFDKAKAERAQVAGHRRTGWQLSSQVAEAQFEDTIGKIISALNRLDRITP